MQRIITAAAFGLALAASSASAETNWTAYTFSPSETLVNVPAMRDLFAEVEKRTGGELKISLKLGGQLPIKHTNISQAVGDNIVQFGDDGFAAGNIPLIGLLKLPLLLQSKEDFQKAREIAVPYIRDAYAEQGILLLAPYYWPAQMVFSTEEFDSLDDFKGRKVETDSPQQSAFVEAFGGAGFSVNSADVPSALQRGTIDTVLTASSGGGKIWADMLDTNYRMPVTEFPAMLIVNKDAFEALSKEHQEIVRSATQDMAPDLTQDFVDDEKKVAQQLKEQGMVITVPSEEELQRATEAMKPYWEEWAKETGPTAQEALSELREAIGR